MKTNIYFIRHADVDYTKSKDRNWELSEKGLEDRKLVTQYLSDKKIDFVYSSPLKRAFDTVKEFADQNKLEIEIVDEFIERKLSNHWIEDFEQFSKYQWASFTYKIGEGESLAQTQERNITALNKILANNISSNVSSKSRNNSLNGSDKNIVIGGHGAAIGTVINYYDKTFTYEQYKRVSEYRPWIAKLTFEGTSCIAIEKINVFDI